MKVRLQLGDNGVGEKVMPISGSWPLITMTTDDVPWDAVRAILRVRQQRFELLQSVGIKNLIFTVHTHDDGWYLKASAKDEGGSLKVPAATGDDVPLGLRCPRADPAVWTAAAQCLVTQLVVICRSATDKQRTDAMAHLERAATAHVAALFSR